MTKKYLVTIDDLIINSLNKLKKHQPVDVTVRPKLTISSSMNRKALLYKVRQYDFYTFYVPMNDDGRIYKMAYFTYKTISRLIFWFIVRTLNLVKNHYND